MTKLEALKNQYRQAVSRLDEVLQKEKNDIIRDSAIKRFEFTFDLAWKLIKAYLEEEKGTICTSPKGCFRDAYRQGVLEYDELWIKITDWRNQIMHVYDTSFADNLYENLPEVLEHFLILQKKIR